MIQQPLIGWIVEKAWQETIEIRIQIGIVRCLIDGDGKLRFRIEKESPVVIDPVNDVIL